MNLEHILKTGALVEIEYTAEDGATNKLNTLVDYPIKDGYFTIYAPMIKGAVFPMRENDTLWVMFMTDNADKTDKDIYKIKCRIEQRGYTNGIAVYKLFQLNEPDKVQRRGAFRLPIVRDFTMMVGEEHRLVHLTTSNISGTGLKSIVQEKMEVGSIVILNLDTELEVLQIPSKIVMCNLLPDSISRYDCRLQFIIEKDMLSQKLNAYLFKKQSEVIQKNIGPSGYSDLYYKLYEKDPYDPEVEAANKQTAIFTLMAALLSLVATTFVFMAVPKDPQIIFKTLIRLNIVFNAWNYTYLLLGTVVAGINLPLCIFGIVVKRRYRLPQQLPVNVPLSLMFLYSLYLFFYGLTHFGA